MHRIAPDDRCLTIVIAAFNEAEALPALQPKPMAQPLVAVSTVQKSPQPNDM